MVSSFHVMLLYKYDGVWLDANILLLKPLNWVLDMQKQQNAEFVGYMIPHFTTIKEFPVIESWFMASVRKSSFMRKVKNEMYRAIGHREQYVDNLRGKIDFQNIPKSLHVYLSIHLAIQYVLQTDSEKQIIYALVDASNDAFKFHNMTQWKAHNLVDDLTSDDPKTRLKYWSVLKKMNIIKFRGDERKHLLGRYIPKQSILGQIL